ncbi:hypothetical protein NBRC116583_03510 [Arenicella sp. 4NH20-0111]
MLLLLSSAAHATEKTGHDLFNKLAELDAVLFNKIFNDCQLHLIENLVHGDFEFYHDKSGVQTRAEFMNTLKENICSSPNRKPIRKLAAGSMKVFEMRDNNNIYGAIQSGEHDFYIRETGKPLYKTGEAKFSHLWVVDDGVWKLKRVLSFDHQNPAITYPSASLEQELDAGYRPRVFGKESEVRAILNRLKIPSMAVGVVDEGVLQQVRVFSVDGKSPINGLYNVASLTKPIVALVVLKLVNAGNWDLDESLAKYHIDDDLRGHSFLGKLTSRHVLSHQSGFPNWRHQAKNNKLTFNFEPGTEYHYSGEGFEYLRRAVEAKLGRPFEKIAKDVLFIPLGMSDTHFYWSDRVDQDRYQYEHNAQGLKLTLDQHETLNAADNLITTAKDYGVFMAHLLNGAELDHDLYQDMFNAQVEIKRDIGFGLGWQRFDGLDPGARSGEYALQHTGSDQGTNALAVMLPNSKRGLVVLSNSDNATKLWTKIVSEHFGVIGNQLMSANFR